MSEASELSTSSKLVKPEELLLTLRERGVRLELEGDQLRLQAPKGAILPAEQAALREHKSALITLLQAENLRPHGLSRYPLTSVQKRLWFLQQLEPHSTRYHEAAALRLNGRPDPAKLKQVLTAWVVRHDILRSSFHYEHSELYQQVHPAAEQLPELTLGNQAEIEAFVQLPFDLSHGPLFRVGLFSEIHTETTDHAPNDPHKEQTVFVLVFHHLITDFWSAGLALNELNALWLGESLPEPSLQYGDYALWQSHQPIPEAALENWRYMLQDVPLGLELGQRRDQQAGTGGLVELPLTAELDERWRNVAASHQVTRFVWLLSAWQVWLCRNFRLEAGVIAFPSVGRPRRELEKMLGCFVNTQLMPFAYQPDAKLSFSELVSQTQSTLLEVLDQASLPFETLVEVLKPPRELSYFPQLGIVMQDSWQVESQQLQLGEYAAEWLELDLAPKFEILLSWLGFRQSLRLNFDAGLFDPRLMQRLLNDFIPFFEATLMQPSLPLNELPLVDFEQAWALKQRWLPQQPVYPGWLHQFVEKHALAQPDAVALRWGNQTISYAELNARANRWARVLQTQGVSLNDRVAVRLQVSPELIVALLAILKAGASYVPIDEDCPQERMMTMLADCQPSLLIAAEETLSSIQDTQLNGLSPLQLDELAKNLNQSHANQNPNLQLMPDALAYIIYTSGSTGRPNGVCITHACASRLFTSIVPVFPTDADDVWLMFHSVAFDYTVWEIWGCFFSGGSLVLLEREQLRNPAATWETVQKQGVTILNQTPSAFRYLSRVACQPDSEGQLTSGKLRKLLISGEKLELNWLQDWFKVFQDTVEVYTSYGITETTVFVTWRRLLAAELSLGRCIIGSPLADLGVRILDEQLQPVPIGVPGELCVLGPGLAPGYWQRPELTAQRYVRDPETGERLYRSGDLVRVDPDGEIVYLGRRDLQIKLRGYRIEAGEIQNVIEALPGVQAAHVALRETAGGPQLLAWVQPAELNPTTLRQQLTGKLPGPMLPAQIIPLEQFPLNQNGKVDTRALPLEMFAGPEQQTAEQVVQVEVLRPDTSAPDYSLFNQPEDQLVHQLGQILAQLLGRRQIGLDENFFELGGHSLLMVEAREKIQRLTGLQLELVDLFQYPTLRQLAHHLRPLPTLADEPAHLPYIAKNLEHNEPIAIIGMALKVPGANSPEDFWDLLSQGRESVRFWTEAELRQAGISETEFRHPDYVPASAWCEGIENFDAEYFGYSPREAEMLDPQQRLMLELALETLERAGYGDARKPQSIGVFASSGISRYLLFHLSRQPLLDTVNPMQVLISTDKDFLATRVAHKLNLTGPALMVQSACSSSLAAVHLACESLRRGECATALAGGVSLDTLPQGYRWLEGAIYSRDGHCRPFDAEASGIIGGSGGAWVLLKPLSAALADGDTIYACIQGSALNNDGADKAGYLAPSVTGQRRVIEAALAHANVKPQQIGVVEAHGTGTAIGDPIELRALRQAWRLERPEMGPFCALGSLKGNLGHLDAAAGVASLIKTALMLHNQKIVPTINVRRPNPQLLLEQSPFYLADKLQDWSGPGRHAAVSSLGIGGTNVHLILAAAPEQAPSLQTTESIGPVLLPISAPTQNSFKQLTANLSQYLAEQVNQNQPISLLDLAYSLQLGRQPQAWRGYLSVSQPSELVESLAQLKATKAPESEALIFLCPGLGSQRPGMGQGLYDALPAYRESIQRSQAQLNKLDWGHHIKTLLLNETDRALLAQPEIMQPLIYCHGLALASGLISLGIRPSAVIGHSFGEYLAVTLAGMAEPDEMLELVLKRGKLFASLPEAGVISVAAKLEQVEPWLEKLSEPVVIAAINAPDRLTLSGSRKALTEFLNQSQLPGRWLDIPHAVHHQMLDGILPALTEAAAAVHWQKPRLPVLSGLSAKWHESAPAPQYWADQGRQQILFSQGLEQLQTSELKKALGIELGIGKTLSALLQRRGLEAFAGPTGESGLQTLLGELWLRGYHPDWSALNHEAESHRRLPLPPTPRQHRRYWIPAKPPGTATASDKLRRDFDDWFELALWRQAPLSQAEATDYLFLDSEQADLAAHLPEHLPNTLLINWPEIQPDQNAFKQALQAFEQQRQRLLQLIKQGWQGRLIWLCPAFSSITGSEELNPWPSLLIGFVRSLAFEAPGIQVRLVETDTGIDQAGSLKLPAAEWAHSEPHVAWRKGRRWLPERVPAGQTGISPLKSQGVYVITGASGGMGQALAKFLQQRYQARLVLISRQTLPDRPDTLPLAVDVTGPEQLKAALASAKAYFGQIDGIFHCAGLPGGHLLAQLTPDVLEQTLAAKILGSLNLKSALDDLDLKPDFVVLASSVASQLGSPGQSAYAAANAWLDAWAHQQGAPWQSINWGTWREGMAGRALSHLPAAWRPLYQHFLNLGMEAHEGTAAFERLLSYNWPQLTVSPVAVDTLARLQTEALQSALSQPALQREQIQSDTDEEPPADPPQGELENILAEVWRRCLGRSPGREDRFGALGGDSLMVVQMKALLEQALGQELPLGLFLEDLSLKALAAGISGEAKPSEELLIKLNAVENGQPLFFVHAISGTVFPFRHLASAINQPFYGLQSRGLISPRPHLDLSAMARDYRRVIEERFAPPYRIGGWSFGGLVAWEMARQWLAEGTDVSELILLDMQAPVPGVATNIDDQGLRERFEADLAGLGPLTLAEQMKERLWRIFEAHVQATLNYHPDVLAELKPKTLLLIAEKGFGATHPAPDLGWSQWLDQPEILRIPGDHYSCLDEDNLNSWAKRLNQ